MTADQTAALRARVAELEAELALAGRLRAELEAAHEELARRKARLRLALDSAGEAYVATDLDGRVLEWNQAAERLYGWTKDEAVGQVMRDRMLHGEVARTYAAERAVFFRDGTGVLGSRVEMPVLCRDGSTKLVEYVFWRTEPAGVPTLHSFAHDIAERKAHERELQVAREAAEAASRAKSAFLANTSHEVRTPLNGVLGVTELLLGTDLDPQQREWAELVKRSGQGLLRVLDDILDLSKIEAGRLELESSGFDLPRLLHDVLAPLRAAVHAKGLSLVLDVGPDVPARVLGDPGRLRQVLANLLGNAVKFTLEGEVRLVARAVADGRVALAVSDTGIGIDRGDQARLFEPFAQADASTTRRFGGTGLGLAISQELVGLLGGELVLSSEPGRGSTFSFTLPLPEVAPLPQARGTAEVLDGLHGLRLLLAEDNPVNRLVAVGLLARSGAAVDVVEDGRQALDLLLAEPATYDAVLMDCQMPVMDGYEAVRAWRRHEAEARLPHLPVVALTASAMAGDRERCLQAGMDEHLGKPFTPQELTAVLAAVLGARAQA